MMQALHCFSLGASPAVLGDAVSSADFSRLDTGQPASPSPQTTPFHRLVCLTRSTDRLLAELAHLTRQRDDTLVYLAKPEANAVLGIARLEQIKRKRSLVLCQLRANRIAAKEFLGPDLSTQEND